MASLLYQCLKNVCVCVFEEKYSQHMQMIKFYSSSIIYML
jgi:hypothetical protein